MQFELKHKPDYTSLMMMLNTGEQLVTETGAMMGMDPALKMETNMKGGILGAAKRALGGESVFMNTYTATADGQRIDVAPSQPGDMEHVQLQGNALMVQKGSYCACTPGIEVSAKWGGAKSFFAGEGLIMLKCSGTGELFLSSYGAIKMVQVQGSYVVDTSHIVAFDEGLQYNVNAVGGAKSTFLSGEGLVCTFNGNGRVWLQTRAPGPLATFLHPFRRVKPKKN